MIWGYYILQPKKKKKEKKNRGVMSIMCLQVT